MKERPILFSGEMVRALLAGRKTQTRRIVKGAWHEPAGYLQSEPTGDDGEWYFACAKVPASFIAHCPYGRPGDRLWVRETHLPTARGVYYRADFSKFDAAGHGAMYGGWKPSIFCLRQHSRLTLEVVAVRVERLQDIGEADALAEGIFRASEALGFYMYDSKGTPGPNCCDTARDTYKCLWESINGPGSWALNPWLWVIEFKLLGGSK